MGGVPGGGELDLLEGLVEVGDDVVDVLCSDGQADGRLVDALVGEFGLRQLGVGGGGRMDDKGFDIGHVRKQGEYLQGVYEPEGLLLPALDFKCEDRASSVREITLVEGVVRM